MSLNEWFEVDRAVLSFFNDCDSLFLDGLASCLTCGYLWIPLYIALLILIIKNNETMGQIALAIGATLVCVILSDGLADFVVKPTVARLRPTEEPLIKYAVHVVNNYRADGFSFFSAHASNTMAIATFFCLVVRNRIFSAFLIFWALTNSWTRLYLGVHYPSDVLVGMAWGAVSGSLVYLLYRRLYGRISPKQHYISSQYTRTGYSLTDIDMMSCVLVATYLFAIIYSVI